MGWTTAELEEAIEAAQDGPWRPVALLSDRVLREVQIDRQVSFAIVRGTALPVTADDNGTTFEHLPEQYDDLDSIDIMDAYLDDAGARERWRQVKQMAAGLNLAAALNPGAGVAPAEGI